MKYTLMVLSLFLLTACFGSPRLDISSLGPHLSDDVGAFVMVAVWGARLSGIAMLLGALALILKRYYLGGQLFFGGVVVLAMTHIMVWVADHIVAISLMSAAALIGGWYLMRYAKHNAVPWLERWLKKDLNKDGMIGDEPVDK